MEMGKVGAVRSEINVTPLVDVCLVLLIIFIVVTPLAQRGYQVKVPPKSTVTGPPPTDQVVVSMTDDGNVYLNKTQMTRQNLALQLGEVLKNRAEKLVFFSVEDKVNYGKAVSMMDLIRNCTGHTDDATQGVKIGIILQPVPVK